MKKLEPGLDRLLRAAAVARQKSRHNVVHLRSASWFMERARKDSIPPGVFLVLKQGLAAACVLLLATGLFALKEIRENQDGITILARASQLQIANTLVP